MIGLEILINQRKRGLRSSSAEKYSYSHIAKLLGITFQSVSNKCKNGKFTVPESLAVFNSLVTEEHLKSLQFYEYLFTEQN